MADDFEPTPARRAAEALHEQRARRAGDPLGEDEVGAQKIARSIRTSTTITATVPADVQQELEGLALGAERVDH